MVKFIRMIQNLNRVAIPQEILTALEWRLGDYVDVEEESGRIIISRKN